MTRKKPRPRGRKPKADAKELVAKKKRVLVLTQQGELALEDIAADVGVHRGTIWGWKQKDPAFAKAMEEVDGEAIRLQVWEGSAYRRIIEGKAAPALEIFWAINVSKRVAPGRWQHVQHILQSNLDVNLAGLPEWALERIAGGEDVVRVVAEVLRQRQIGDAEGASA